MADEAKKYGSAGLTAAGFMGGLGAGGAPATAGALRSSLRGAGDAPKNLSVQIDEQPQYIDDPIFAGTPEGSVEGDLFDGGGGEEWADPVGGGSEYGVDLGDEIDLAATDGLGFDGFDAAYDFDAVPYVARSVGWFAIEQS